MNSELIYKTYNTFAYNLSHFSELKKIKRNDKVIDIEKCIYMRELCTTFCSSNTFPMYLIF